MYRWINLKKKNKHWEKRILFRLWIQTRGMECHSSAAHQKKVDLCPQEVASQQLNIVYRSSDEMKALENMEFSAGMITVIKELVCTLCSHCPTPLTPYLPYLLHLASLFKTILGWFTCLVQTGRQRSQIPLAPLSRGQILVTWDIKVFY